MADIETARTPVAASYRFLFMLALSLTLLVLIMPGAMIDVVRLWVQGWWPWPSSGMNSGALSVDKLVHAGLFGLCGWTLVRGWMSSARRWLIFYLPLLALGGLTEVLQHFVPGRGADPLDLVADGVGATLGMAFALGQIKSTGRADR